MTEAENELAKPAIDVAFSGAVVQLYTVLSMGIDDPVSIENFRNGLEKQSKVRAAALIELDAVAP